MERRTIKSILLVVVILFPMFTYMYLDSALKMSIPVTNFSSDAIFLTLKDFWYPADQETQIYPMYILGIDNGIYRRPILTLPSMARIDVFAMDATNNTVDLTWIAASSLTQLWEGESVNVSYTPLVNGTFGDEGVIYQEGVERFQMWNAYGTPDDIRGMTLESGLPRKNNQSYSHLCTIELTYDLSPEHYFLEWNLLLGLEINRSDAVIITGHEIDFMISYTYYYTDYLLGGLQIRSNWTQGYPRNLTLGNGETYGQWDCGTIYVLEGNIDFHILNS